jgi:hypothetical protein
MHAAVHVYVDCRCIYTTYTSKTAAASTQPHNQLELLASTHLHEDAEQHTAAAGCLEKKHQNFKIK